MQNMPSASYTDREEYTFSPRAKWIWAEDNRQKNDFVAFRKEFFLHQIPDRVIFAVAAETKYWMYINGRLAVFEGGLFRESTPGNGYADLCELTSYLKEGQNVIGIICRYIGAGGRGSVDSGEAGLRLEAKEIDIYSDESFYALRHPAYYTPAREAPAGLYGGAHIGYDTNKRIGNFSKVNYLAYGWPQARVYDGAAFGRTLIRPIPLLRYGAPHVNCNILSGRDGEEYTYTMKLPYAMAFTPIVQLTADGGERLWLSSDREWVNGGPGDEHNRYHAQCVEYVCNAGFNHFDCLHYLYGERFVIRSKKPLSIQAMGYHETGYPADICGSFVCDDEVLNALIEKSARTLYVCMRDNFMDCPDRERGQWIGDVSVQTPQVFWLLTPSAKELVRKAIFDFLLLRDGDVLRGLVPGKDSAELPSQSLVAIGKNGMIAEYDYFTGDDSVLEAALSPCVAYLKLWEIEENGLVKHREGDWGWFDHLYNADVPVLENSLYASALSFALTMAERVGNHAYDAFLQKRLTGIEQGFAQFWNGTYYASGDITDDRANAMAVLSGLCPKEYYPQMRAVLLKTFNATPYMENFVLTALCEMGYCADAYRRMTARYYPLAQNKDSTLWEDFYILGSRNHGWSGAPVNIAFRYFLGVRSEDGFKTASVHLQEGLFDSVNACFPIGKKLHYVSYNRYAGTLKETDEEIPRY